MHELSLCHAIAGVAKPHAVGRHVNVVRVQVGALRQVVPESLEFCWSLICQHLDDTMVDTALELELVAAEVLCRGCGQHSRIESRWSAARGNEFLVTSVQVS